MKTKRLNIISIIAGISLIGILLTQGLWLHKTNTNAQKNFDHRTDQMLTDVLSELENFSDTSETIQIHYEKGDLCFYDVVDTLLLKKLLYKYANYHKLDTIFNYALVESQGQKVVHSSEFFDISQEEEAYKVCLSCIWKKEYIHLSLFFPGKAKFIRGSLIIWIFLSVLFTITTLAAFIFIIISIYRQKKDSEIKTDFVNNMTHELKTPLATISVASEVLMKNNTDTDKTRKYSKIIFDENHRMRKLVEKVLNIATLDSNRQVIELAECDMHATICKTISNFCLEACADDTKIDYKLEAKDPIIHADLLHIRNVLNNLVDNAIKYSEDTPQITISTKTITNYIKISVSDKGKGIPKDGIKKVFDKFYRVPSGNIHNVKGFGLGLFYVKSIIEAHNGRVEIDSQLNKGTTVNLYLPQ